MFSRCIWCSLCLYILQIHTVQFLILFYFLFVLLQFTSIFNSHDSLKNVEMYTMYGTRFLWQNYENTFQNLIRFVSTVKDAFQQFSYHGYTEFINSSRFLNKQFFSLLEFQSLFLLMFSRCLWCCLCLYLLQIHTVHPQCLILLYFLFMLFKLIFIYMTQNFCDVHNVCHQISLVEL